jgi:PE family/PPE-SVP subfamily C-terminal region
VSQKLLFFRAFRGYATSADPFLGLPYNSTLSPTSYGPAHFHEEEQMSFVTTQPEALSAAASTLQHLGTSMADESAAAAAPTTGVVPAAADEVSALQATQFSTYGTLYQQVSAQAAAVHQMLVNTLGTSAGSYGETEAANQAVTGSGVLGAATVPAQGAGLSSSTGATIGTPLDWAQQVGSAASDFFGTGTGFLYPGASEFNPKHIPIYIENGLMGSVTPTGPAGLGAAPVLARSGQAPSVGGMSAPPSWAAAGSAPVSPSPAALAGNGWTSPAPHGASVNAVPGGVPSVASAGRGSTGFGAPRYGVKPTVMPKPTAV